MHLNLASLRGISWLEKYSTSLTHAYHLAHNLPPYVSTVYIVTVIDPSEYNVQFLVHYIDNFLTAGPPDFLTPPLIKAVKMVVPCTPITFLDTNAMIASICTLLTRRSLHIHNHVHTMKSNYYPFDNVASYSCISQM